MNKPTAVARLTTAALDKKLLTGMAFCGKLVFNGDSNGADVAVFVDSKNGQIINKRLASIITWLRKAGVDKAAIEAKSYKTGVLKETAYELVVDSGQNSKPLPFIRRGSLVINVTILTTTFEDVPA